MAQFSLYVHKGGLKPDSFHLHRVEHRDIQVRRDGFFWGNIYGNVSSRSIRLKSGRKETLGNSGKVSVAARR